MGKIIIGFLIKELKGMLFHEGKKYLLYFSLMLCVFSCKENNAENFGMLNKRDAYLKVNFFEYKDVFKFANDTLNKWITDSLDVSASIAFGDWELDSVIIFSNDKKIFKSTINIKIPYQESVADENHEFSGRKIDGKWYFFFGSTLVLTREYYQDSIYTPMSFEELSFLAYKNQFKYYVENKIPLSDDYLDPYFDLRDCPKGSRLEINRCLDSLALKTNAEYNRKKLSSETIARLQHDKNEKTYSVEPFNNKRSWWQFWKEVPIFETEEWKDYLKQKYGSNWDEHL
jgi:hypothetical protein